MRVLVTGGAGFIGSHIVARHLDLGDDVLVVDDMSTGKRTNLPPETRIEELDIGDPKLLDVASAFRPHVISHCAAQVSVVTSMAEPAMDAATNIVGGINVCQAAIRSGCAQLIYVSTGGALYGVPKYLPCDEDHPIQPISAYGLSKWSLECYLRLLLPDSTQLKVLRLANVYGPRQDPHGEAGVVSIFALRMLCGAPVEICGDGEQTRDFVYVEDVAKAHELAQRTSDPVTVNIGSGAATSVNALLRDLAAETGYTRPPVYEAERPGEVKHIVLLSPTRWRTASLDGRLRRQLREGLRSTVAWTKSELATT